jgi:probable selenium-dependent hydroxylase accessory protein YqeC
LAHALALEKREAVAMVGAGGKTSALRLLAAELEAAGSSVIATTTTAMYARELATVGPLVLEAEEERMSDTLEVALSGRRVVAVAAGEAPGGKVTGLSAAVVDSVWEAGLTDYLLVEADGSRGLPFKAFGPDEPQVPRVTSTVVQVAGLQVVGRPLIGAHVHRAARMAEALGVPLGCEVTPRLFVDGLRLQLAMLRSERLTPRIVTLLNGTDSPAAESLGLAVADDLLERDGGAIVVVLASLHERRAARATAFAA